MVGESKVSNISHRWDNYNGSGAYENYLERIKEMIIPQSSGSQI
jgi:hypothetical protein